ncbi:MAG: cyclic nucleotide-binding domain-containing protein [Myxococcales bacterium]|nr:cyclic nucleotide-binding domain-containing protein [Myxococcales bacterium]
MGDTSGRATPTVSADMLKGIALFDGFDDEARGRLARTLPTAHFEVGQLVIREGDDDREMFVVLSGELEVHKHSPAGHEVRVALLGPGDWFGDMSIVDPQERSASVRVLAPTMALRIAAIELEGKLRDEDLRTYALLMRNIARELARRLRVADKILSQLVLTVGDTYRRPT